MSLIELVRRSACGLYAGYKRICVVVLSLLSLALIASCDADLQPLEEAVLASNLQIASIEIQPGIAQSDDIVLNAGEQLQFEFSAFNTVSTQALIVETTNRRWSSSNRSVGTISDSGLFVAGADGQTIVSLRIGGVASNPVSITVSSAPLTGIASINGPESVSECSGNTYTATGQFADGTQRLLNNLQWQLVSQDVADTNPLNGTSVVPNPSSAVVLARSAGTFTLEATQENFTLQRDVTIFANVNNLQIVAMPFILPIGSGQTVNLEALADFNDGPVGSPVADIVAWSVINPSGGDTIATVLAPDANGIVMLQAGDAGSATLQALCGSAMSSVVFTVIDTVFSELLVLLEFDNGADDQNISGGTLTLNVGETATITATARPVGTADDSRIDVTSLAQVDDVAGDEDAVDIDEGNEIEIQGVSSGTVTLEISVNGDSETFEVTVN